MAIVLAAVAAASLGGCASAPLFAPVPGSVEEQLWFDRAQGYNIHNIPPDVRVRGAIGYPRIDFSAHRHPPFSPENVP